MPHDAPAGNDTYSARRLPWQLSAQARSAPPRSRAGRCDCRTVAN